MTHCSVEDKSARSYIYIYIYHHHHHEFIGSHWRGPVQPEEVAGTTSLKVEQARHETEGKSNKDKHDQGGEKSSTARTRQDRTRQCQVQSGQVKTMSGQAKTEQDKAQ